MDPLTTILIPVKKLQESRVRRGVAMILQPLIQVMLRRALFVSLFASRVRSEDQSGQSGISRCPDYVANYAPLVWLHSSDPYRPSDLLTHIQHTTPMHQEKVIPDLPPLDLNNLDILNESGDRVTLSATEDPLTSPAWILGEAPDANGQIHNATPCVVVLVERNEAELDAFYFYFYSFNEGPNITHVLEPLNHLLNNSVVASGIHFGDHVGDWEHNMIRFRKEKPTGIYYSQHVDGKAWRWDDSTISKLGDRPVVYSARGSHANYPGSGEQIHNAGLLDFCDEGLQWDPLLSAYYYRFDAIASTFTRILSPNETSLSPNANPTSFLNFSGLWGNLQLPENDPRQETVPYVGMKRFVSGPTGPRYKQLVRKGLRPDARRRHGWNEWGVNIVMFLYPHFLKGWRKWVFLVFVVIGLAGLALGVRRGIKRFRSSPYRMLKTEDIRLDDWAMEEEFLLSSSDELDEDESDH